ncbi:MAG TPA: hypothetical protein VEW95_13010 [Candidatus Limnocylindrales bacterium]|nr:hypothetical protein [Candidatus Limnocylindrales bacterium]
MAKAARPNATSKADAAADPDKLVRQQAGTYRTADERFEVREADAGWFLVDSAQTNEFGQELIQGPFATLKALRAALPGARESKPAGRPRAPSKKPARAAKTDEKPKPPPKPSWIDQLPKADAAAVRKLIGALEREGVADAEALVRRDREGLLPAVATRLIERRLDALVEDLPAGEQKAARALIRRAAEVISTEGSSRSDPLPGWTLVETGSKADPPNRRIDLRK